VLWPVGAGVERGEGGERVIPLDPLQTPAVVPGNLFWVVYGIVTENPYVMVMFGFYWVTAVVGVVNAGKTEWV